MGVAIVVVVSIVLGVVGTEGDRFSWSMQCFKLWIFESFVACCNCWSRWSCLYDSCSISDDGFSYDWLRVSSISLWPSTMMCLALLVRFRIVSRMRLRRKRVLFAAAVIVDRGDENGDNGDCCTERSTLCTNVSHALVPIHVFGSA